ncbi:C2H2-type zinc finger transcription factor [Mucor lusitanicus]
MKLRARKRSFPSKIKQEDCKPTLIDAQSSAIKVANTSTVDLTIKQEDSKDHKLMLKQHGNCDSEDYYYCCNICDQRLPNFKSVLEHRKSNHISSKRFKGTTMAKNLDKEPDLYNPNFYCESCEKGYSDQHAYRCHLRKVHFMVLKQPRSRMTQKIDITPDPNDPSLHCRACNFTYKHKQYYKKHCRFTHGVNTAKFANRASSYGSLTDSYCQTCDKRLSSISYYRQHLFIKKMSSRVTFRRHLKYVHSLLKSTTRQSQLKPDVDDPNNYCRACQKMYPSKDRYRAHLRMVHQMILTSLKRKSNHKQLPDPYNRDYYCSVCKKNYVEAKLYRRHCKQAHFMILGHSSIVNPNAEINVNDPDLYCSQCERAFSREILFKRHLGRVHSIM